MTGIVMIAIQDDKGRQWTLNLRHVIHVEFPSKLAPLSNNMGLELITMIDGTKIRSTLGTWQAAIDTLYGEFDDNPQPKENVKDKIFIIPQT